MLSLPITNYQLQHPPPTGNSKHHLPDSTEQVKRYLTISLRRICVEACVTLAQKCTEDLRINPGPGRYLPARDFIQLAFVKLLLECHSFCPLHWL